MRPVSGRVWIFQQIQFATNNNALGMATAALSHHSIWLADALHVQICGVHQLIRCRDEARLLPYHEFCYWQTWFDRVYVVRTAFQDFSISHV